MPKSIINNQELQLEKWTKLIAWLQMNWQIYSLNQLWSNLKSSVPKVRKSIKIMILNYSNFILLL